MIQENTSGMQEPEYEIKHKSYTRKRKVARKMKNEILPTEQAMNQEIIDMRFARRSVQDAK
jgi:hypothetical protein